MGIYDDGWKRNRHNNNTAESYKKKIQKNVHHDCKNHNALHYRYYYDRSNIQLLDVSYLDI